eukprot:g1817.t1
MKRWKRLKRVKDGYESIQKEDKEDDDDQHDDVTEERRNTETTTNKKIRVIDSGDDESSSSSSSSSSDEARPRKVKRKVNRKEQKKNVREMALKRKAAEYRRQKEIEEIRREEMEEEEWKKRKKRWTIKKIRKDVPEEEIQKDAHEVLDSFSSKGDLRMMPRADLETIAVHLLINNVKGQNFYELKKKVWEDKMSTIVNPEDLLAKIREVVSGRLKRFESIRSLRELSKEDLKTLYMCVQDDMFSMLECRDQLSDDEEVEEEPLINKRIRKFKFRRTSDSSSRDKAIRYLWLCSLYYGHRDLLSLGIHRLVGWDVLGWSDFKVVNEYYATNHWYLDSLDDSDRLPIQIAVMADSFTSLDWLLKRGVDIDSEDKFGQTLLHHAAGKCNGLKMTKYLLSKGADESKRDMFG